MKIDRLIAILSILLQKEKVTSYELAEKLEVSRRTIFRDIEAISRAGIPIVSESGQGGGIYIMEGYRIDRTLLSREDMKAILAGLQGLDSVSGTNRYRMLMEKIIPADYSEGNIIIDLSNWGDPAVPEKIEIIKAAMEKGVKISFRYYSPNSIGTRTIEPYHLIFQWSGWYVWGFCTKRQDYRMFRLTRMSGLVLTDEKREEREVPAYTCDKLRHTKGEIRATVKFDKSVKWRIMDEFGTSLPGYDENGDIILTFTWSDVPSFYRFILSYGDNAEIIEPDEYRKEFSQLLKNMQKKYEI